jgi:FkbM family methyltransferase
MMEHANLAQRLRKFAARPAREQYVRLALRVQRVFSKTPIPIRLGFGGWFLVGTSWVDHAILFGEIEKAEILFVERYLRAGMTVLDIGAHHGLYTLLASKRVGAAGRVVAFEPSSRERAQLLRNVKINFCSNVRIEACALGGERSQAELFLVKGGEDGCNSLRPPIAASGASAMSVAVARLDDWMEENGM